MSSYGLWLSAAGMKVQEHRQTLLANNMANANTAGFKSDLAMVLQRQIESRSSAGAGRYSHPILDSLPGGIDVRPAHVDFSPGPIEHTQRPLDAAIDGEGFFAVSDGGSTQYTRAGSFTLNGAGELVMTSGEGRWRVLDDGGNRIQLDSALGDPEVSQDGTIRQDGETVATIGFWKAPDEQSLRKVGENLFAPVNAEVELSKADGRVITESLEGSNFEVMTGLASMIEASRAYQMNATLLQFQDQVTGQAVNTVGRLA